MVSSPFCAEKTASEAILPDLLRDHLLDALDGVHFLALEVALQVLQLRLSVGVGDVLVVAPQSVEAPAEVVNQVVVVVGTTAGFSDVFQFLFRCQCHDEPPFGEECP
jgi:hypothetical protein